VRVVPSGPLSDQVRLLPLKLTENAAFGHCGERPGAKVVGWPRFSGAGENLFLLPMETPTLEDFSLR
jgi:hypothetical protein